jgi:hypothetical protein
MPKVEVNNDRDSLGYYIVSTYETLKGDRVNWDAYWDELSWYIQPKKNNVYGARQKGERRSEDLLYDTTSIDASEYLASGLHSMLTNPSTLWFGFSTGEDKLDNSQEFAQWVDATTRKMFQILGTTNFHTQVHEYYLDQTCFGTGTLRIEDDDVNVLRFDSRPIYEHYIGENNRGAIDTVYRKYKFTVKQMVEEFGKDVIPRELLDELDDPKKITKEHEIVHGIGPRRNSYPWKVLDKTNKNFYSVHVLAKTRTVLRNSGFDDNPIIVCRWSKLSNEVYGRGPGMKALPDIKMLNAMSKTLLQALQLNIAPPLQAPDTGVLLPIKLRPYSTNIYRSGSRDRIEPLITNVQPVKEESLLVVRERVRNHFYSNQLQLPEKHPQMTATEVMQRTEEKLRILGPILGRQHHEFLQPFVERIFRKLIKKKEIELPPADLQNVNLGIRYVSRLAQAQRSTDADSFLRVMQSMSPILQSSPEIMDNFDGDSMLRYFSSVYGFPKFLLRDEDDVGEIRESRQQQLEQQEQMEVQESEAKSFSDATKGASNLQDVMEGAI